MAPNTNPYTLPTEGAEFTAYCGGNLGGDNETCVEIAAHPSAADTFIVRDNKPEAPAGTVLLFSGTEMDTWASKWVRDRGLTV
jgi:hypothetical protein